MTRARYGRFLSVLKPHGVTMTDLFTLYIEQIIPILEKARPVEVASFVPDDRRSGRPKWKKGTEKSVV
jgi:hypothetical protein